MRLDAPPRKREKPPRLKTKAPMLLSELNIVKALYHQIKDMFWRIFWEHVGSARPKWSARLR